MSDNEERAVNMWLWDILKNHFGHKVSIAIYGDVNSPASVTLEDEDTGSIILDAGIYTLQERSDGDW
jgi:hypothetical protein